MQILVHMRIFNVAFPANANLVTTNIINVATFDIPFVEVDFLLSPFGKLSSEDTSIDPTEEGTTELRDALNELGYSSHYMGRIMGSVYIIIMLTTLALILMLCLAPIKSKVNRASSMYNYLRKALLWNYLIRLVFEACIELTFVMILSKSK